MGSLLNLLAADATQQDWYKKILQPMLNLIDDALVPIIIVVATVGTLYAIWLGISLARAESEDARTEAKKKMIYFIIAFVVTIILLILLKLLAGNATEIRNAIDNAA